MDWSTWLAAVEDECIKGGDPQSRLFLSQIRDRVLHKAALKKGDHVLDLGCGRGFLSLEAARLTGEVGMVYGVDLSAGALEQARKEAESREVRQVRFLQADLLSLPFADQSMDAVVGRSVFAYLERRDLALAEAWRVLRRGGRISLFEPLLGEESYILSWGELEPVWRKMRWVLSRNHPAYNFGVGELTGMMREAGFEQVESFVWHVDVTRAYASGEEVREEFDRLLPEDLSLVKVWKDQGISDEEIEAVMERIYQESQRQVYRNILPCVYLWGSKG